MIIEQTFLIVGATVAGACFAMAVTSPEKRNLYYAMGVAGLSMIAFAYFQLAN